MVHVLGLARMELNNDVLRLPKKILHDAHDFPCRREHRAILKADADVLPAFTVGGDDLDLVLLIYCKPETSVKAERVITAHRSLTDPGLIQLFPISHIIVF